jgi:hypothetical protein
LEEVVTLVAKESVVEASPFRVDDWVIRVIFKINQAEAVAWSVKSFMQVKGHEASVVILRMEKLLLYALCVRHFAKTTFVVKFILNPASSRAIGRVFGSEPDFTLKNLLADALLRGSYELINSSLPGLLLFLLPSLLLANSSLFVNYHL